jgi:hypothetical protein
MDEQIAEQRDYVFYSRLVQGIGQTQYQSLDKCLQMENQMCLSHIMQTRYEGQSYPEKEDWSFEFSHDAQFDKDLVYSIAADALAVATSDEEGIFELDL